MGSSLSTALIILCYAGGIALVILAIGFSAMLISRSVKDIKSANSAKEIENNLNQRLTELQSRKFYQYPHRTMAPTPPAEKPSEPIQFSKKHRNFSRKK